MPHVLSSVFLLVFVTGLVLGVFAMLYGTERRPRTRPALAPHERASEHDVATEPSPLFNLSTVAALVFATGLTGTLLTRLSTLGVGAIAGLALGAGALAFLLQAVLIARWAIPSARADVGDERFLLQGIIGEVVAEAPAGGTGLMRYTLDGDSYTVPVIGLDGQPLPAGCEVSVDRIEGGVVVAEPWAQVEQRL